METRSCNSREEAVAGSEDLLVLQSELQQTVGTVNIELCRNVGAMGFDGPEADAKIVGDLFACLIPGNESQDSAFCISQVGKRRLA